MRWLDQKKPPKVGDRRIKYRFLWFPKKLPQFIEDPKILEWRWLERAAIQQKYVRHPTGQGWVWTPYYWVDERWVD